MEITVTLTDVELFALDEAIGRSYHSQFRTKKEKEQLEALHNKLIGAFKNEFGKGD